jgi:hypothetical protein
MSVRGVPVQDLQENQDPSVAYFLNEQTGEKTRFDGKPVVDEKEEADDDEKDESTSSPGNVLRPVKPQRGRPSAEKAVAAESRTKGS